MCGVDDNKIQTHQSRDKNCELANKKCSFQCVTMKQCIAMRERAKKIGNEKKDVNECNKWITLCLQFTTKESHIYNLKCTRKVCSTKGVCNLYYD